MAATAARWSSRSTIAVVTGSNKGIGYEIVKLLSKRGVTTVLTARDEGRGQQALNSLKSEGYEGVYFHLLDVTSAQSAEKLAAWLKKEFDGIDILINNAAIAKADVSYEVAKETLDTNFYGVQTVTNKLLPVINPGGRIVIVSSQLGSLSNLKEDSPLLKIFQDEKNFSEDVANAYAKKYLESVKSGTWREDGWCSRYPMYSDSKVLLNLYTRGLAKTLAAKNISVNDICPGYVATDMNNHSGTGTAAEGADTPVWLALLPDDKYPTGKFFSKRTIIPF